MGWWREGGEAGAANGALRLTVIHLTIHVSCGVLTLEPCQEHALAVRTRRLAATTR